MPRTASPRSVDATGPNERPFELFLDAAQTQDWKLLDRQALGPTQPTKPGLVQLRRGRTQLNWVLYGWYVTLEGYGRRKNDYRIQTTRFNNSDPLYHKPGWQTVGIGWNVEREVFFGFDGWAERLKGKSTSVHVKRATLDAAKADGVCKEGPRYDVRFAFEPGKVDDFITWVRSLADKTARDAVIIPEDLQVSGDNAVIVADVQKPHAASWLRQGDRIVIVDKAGAVADPGLWKIDTITAKRKQTAQQNAWRLLEFSCRKTGRIKLPLDSALLKPLR